MADFTIYRQGLDATIVGSASIGAQSEAVTFTVESDGSYAGYKTNLYYQYGDTRALAAASNNVFTVPVQAFKQTGDVLLSVELSSGSNRPVCNPCVLRVTSSAKKTDASVLPSDGTWQALVKTQVQNQINDTVFKPHGSINTGSFNDIKSPGGYVAGPNLTERPPESGYGYLSVTVSDFEGKAVTQEWVRISSPYKAYRRTLIDSTHAWTEWYGVGLTQNALFSTKEGAFTEAAIKALVEAIPGDKNTKAEMSAGSVNFNGQRWSYLFNYAPGGAYYAFLFFNYGGTIVLVNNYNDKLTTTRMAKQADVDAINASLTKVQSAQLSACAPNATYVSSSNEGYIFKVLNIVYLTFKFVGTAYTESPAFGQTYFTLPDWACPKSQTFIPAVNAKDNLAYQFMLTTKGEVKISSAKTIPQSADVYAQIAYVAKS